MKFGDRELYLNVYPNLSNPIVDEKCLKKDIFDRGDPLVKEDHPKENCYMVDRFEAVKNNTVKGEKKKLKKPPDLGNATRRFEMVDPVRNTIEDLPGHKRVAFVEAQRRKSSIRPP